jgi:hypothetical protein
MGETIKSLMSWEGKNHDSPKPYAKVTSSKEPVTHEQLAQFERDILKMLDEMADKMAKKQADANKGS